MAKPKPTVLLEDRPWVTYVCSCGFSTVQRDGIVVGHDKCPQVPSGKDHIPKTMRKGGNG